MDLIWKDLGGGRKEAYAAVSGNFTLSIKCEEPCVIDVKVSIKDEGENAESYAPAAIIRNRSKVFCGRFEFGNQPAWYRFEVTGNPIEGSIVEDK